MLSPIPSSGVSSRPKGAGGTSLSLLRLLNISLCLILFRALIAPLSLALFLPPPDTRTPRLLFVFGALKLLLPLGVRVNEDPETARWAPTLAITRDREIRGRRAGIMRGLGALVSEAGTCDGENGIPLEKIPFLVVVPPLAGGGDITGTPPCTGNICSGTFANALGSPPMRLGRDAALDNERGLTVLCILASELAVGANSVDVLFLTTLFVLLFPTSLGRTPDGTSGFFKPIELAADDPRELPVPVPLEFIFDPRAPLTLARLLVRDIRPRGCWNKGMAPRRPAEIPEAEEGVIDIVPDDAVLDLVPAAEFVLVLVDIFLPNPFPVTGIRKLLLESGGLAVDVLATGGLGTLGLAAGAGFVRTFGVSFLLAAGTVLWGAPVTGTVDFCLGALLPIPFQTLLTMLFAEDRKPNLVVIPFFADMIQA